MRACVGTAVGAVTISGGTNGGRTKAACASRGFLQSAGMGQATARVSAHGSVPWQQRAQGVRELAGVSCMRMLTTHS